MSMARLVELLTPPETRILVGPGVMLPTVPTLPTLPTRHLSPGSSLTLVLAGSLGTSSLACELSPVLVSW